MIRRYISNLQYKRELLFLKIEFCLSKGHWTRLKSYKKSRELNKYIQS